MKKCKRLLSIFLAVMMLLGCVQAAFIVGAESASTVKVATISDIRYQAGAADKDGLMLSKSAALLDAAIAKVKASDADVLLVTGDLTNNGSKTSHQYVASKPRQKSKRRASRFMSSPASMMSVKAVRRLRYRKQCLRISTRTSAMVKPSRIRIPLPMSQIWAMASRSS